MMTKTGLSLLGLVIGLGSLPTLGLTKPSRPLPHPHVGRLTHEERAKIRAATEKAIDTPRSGDAYIAAMNHPPTAKTATIVVAGPPHDSSDHKLPDTSPQSTGTPSVDTPFVAVIPQRSGTSAAPKGQ